MPFQIVHNDITKMNTDAIVNAANYHLQEGGGVCGAIFKAAGEKQLQEECNRLGSCMTGQAVITNGYQLSAKHVIHAVGPIWRGGHDHEEELLASAYKSSLELAVKYNLKSIAFPLISSGIYGFPKEKALQTAISIFREFLLYHEMDIYLVVFDRKAISISEKLFQDINHYIDTFYDDAEEDARRTKELDECIQDENHLVTGINELKEIKHIHKKLLQMDECMMNSSASARSLEDLMNNIDETFTMMLFRLIDEKGLTDVEVYKRANMDRKLFSKIRSNSKYQPSKRTVVSLAIALKLSLDETKDLLNKAGYSLSNSNRFDIIIRYFIEKQTYDVYLINEALFTYEQPLLGV